MDQPTKQRLNNTTKAGIVNIPCEDIYVWFIYHNKNQFSFLLFIYLFIFFLMTYGYDPVGTRMDGRSSRRSRRIPSLPHTSIQDQVIINMSNSLVFISF